MDMKRVEEMTDDVAIEMRKNEFSPMFVEAFKVNMKEVFHIIKQQQEVLDGVGKLNEYLQTQPRLTKGRVGQPVTLIAIDVIKQQQEEIDGLKGELKETYQFLADKDVWLQEEADEEIKALENSP